MDMVVQCHAFIKIAILGSLDRIRIQGGPYAKLFGIGDDVVKNLDVIKNLTPYGTYYPWIDELEEVTIEVCFFLSIFLRLTYYL